MLTERYHTLICRSRREKVAKLVSAIKHIGFANRYYGASISTTINFQETYNRPDQVQIYGQRTRQDLARASEKEESTALAEFGRACYNCEFRCVEGACCGNIDENRVFNILKENPTARKRFLGRLENEEIEQGYKSAPCLRLLQKARLKATDWTL